MGIPFAYLHFSQKPVLRDLGLFSKGPFTDAKNTAILFGVLVAVSLLLGLVLTFLNLNDMEKVGAEIAALGTQYPGYLLLLIIGIGSVSEEIFFRGFLVKRLGVYFSALVFGAAHAAYGSVAEIAGALVLGLVLGMAFERWGNLLPNMVAHVIYNFIALAVLA